MINKENYQKLDEPIIVQQDDTLGFVLVTHIDLTLLAYNQIGVYGRHYNYDTGDVYSEGEYREIAYSLTKEGHITTDESGRTMD